MLLKIRAVKIIKWDSDWYVFLKGNCLQWENNLWLTYWNYFFNQGVTDKQIIK